jgi:hypothetical protein
MNTYAYHHPELDKPWHTQAKNAVVDPLIRSAVQKINASGWVWTAESCQGHPDESRTPVWASNVKPMLRLICRVEHEGAMLSALMAASRSMAVAPDDEENLTAWGRPCTVGLEIFPDERGQPDWCEALVYIPAATAWDRDRGIQAFERFGMLVNTRDLVPEQPQEPDG